MIAIAPDKVIFFKQKAVKFLYFSTKTYLMGTHQKHLSEVLLMSTHNICFHGEIRKNIIWIPSLIWSFDCAIFNQRLDLLKPANIRSDGFDKRQIIRIQLKNNCAVFNQRVTVITHF